jgi:hypothetical protein
MLLDSRQRLIFMEWCKTQAENCQAIADQIDKSMVHGMADQLSKRERQKAAAFSIVAMQLSKRERQKAAAFSIVAMELAAVREEFSVKAEDVGDVQST